MPETTKILPPLHVDRAGNSVKTNCRKCGTAVTLNFGRLDRAEAAKTVAQLDSTPMECPGYHVELGGWRRLWRMDEALEALYPSVPEAIAA